MLRLLKNRKTSNMDAVRVLMLSRKERDIEDELRNVCIKVARIQNEAIGADIKVHVRHLLANDSRLSKWAPAIKKEIEVALVEGAHGM